METNADTEVRREKVNIQKDMSTKDIMQKFGVSQTTAYRAKKTGWVIKNYSRNQIIIDRDNFHPAKSYSVAKQVYWKKFRKNPIAECIKDDLIQTAVMLMFMRPEKSKREPMKNTMTSMVGNRQRVLWFVSYWCINHYHQSEREVILVKSNIARITLVFFLFLLSISNFAFAETKTFVREYTFQAGDEDSKNSSRTISLREVKRLLLEELGTYLESTTEVQNFQLTKDQIITLTAGVVRTELVEEKWDGRTYWIKAKIQADSGDVIKAIDTLRKDRQKTRELEDIRKKSDALLKENERLRRELATSKGEKKKKDTKAYKKTIQDLNATEWFDKGYVEIMAGRWKEALDFFTKSIELDPQYAEAYGKRGVAYVILGNSKQAIKDYDKAIELNPQDAPTYYNRGNAHGALGNTNQAIKDYDKAIELNPQWAMAHKNRGNTYDKLGNHKQAIKDYDKAIELNPQDAKVYFDRGLAYAQLGNNNQALMDYNKAIELDPEYALPYIIRGNAYNALGNIQQAIMDYNKAIELTPQFAVTYIYRGDAYGELGNYQQAIKDYSKAIEFDPLYVRAYVMRGGCYGIIGNEQQAIADLKIAARLGDESAQKMLRSKKIEW